MNGVNINRNKELLSREETHILSLLFDQPTRNIYIFIASSIT